MQLIEKILFKKNFYNLYFNYYSIKYIILTYLTSFLFLLFINLLHFSIIFQTKFKKR